MDNPERILEILNDKLWIEGEENNIIGKIEAAKKIHEHYYPKEFVHYLLTQTNYPLLFAKISKEKTEEYFICWQDNDLGEFIEWRDKNCKRLQNGDWMQKYKHKSKTSTELYKMWLTEIKNK